MRKKSIAVILIISILLLLVCLVFTGFLDGFLNKITGKAVAEDNLIIYYNFEGNAQDSTENGINGAIFGNPKFVDGIKGKALSFDGDKDYVLVGDRFDLEKQEFTLSFWAQHNNPSGEYQGGVAKGYVFGNVNEFSYKMDFHSGKIRAEIVNTQKSRFETSSYVDGGWHMWAMTVGDDELSLYKDGKLEDASDYIGTIDYRKLNNNFIISARDDSLYSFNGLIDEVKFWDYALSANEVQREYNSVITDQICTDTCTSLGYECGNYIICDKEKNCGECEIEPCSEETCKKDSLIIRIIKWFKKLFDID